MINSSSFYDYNSSNAAAIQVYNSSPTLNTDTIAGESDSWNGVRFAVKSSGSLNNCTIENLGDGNGVIIQGGSSPTIFSNSILNNYYHGITVYYNGTANPQITDNLIKNNTINNYVGLYFQSSIGGMRNNNVSGFTYGSWCRYASSPNSGGLSQEGGNVITNNIEGIVATDNSYPEFGGGLPAKDECYGVCNQFNSNNSYDAISERESDITAQFDWWGQYPPNTLKMHTDSSSYIDYTGAETSQYDCVLNQGATPINQTNIVGPVSSSNASASPSMQQSRQYILAGNYAKAALLCRNLLKDSSTISLYKQALVTMFNIFQSSSDSTIVNYLYNYASQKNGLVITAKILLASAYEAEGKFADAEKIANNLILSYPNSETEKQALFILSSLSGYEPSYKDVSTEALNALVQKYSSSIDSSLIAMIGLQGNSNLSRSVSLKTAKKKVEQDLNIIHNYQLLGNYPNPFNPTTDIKYQIPNNSYVTLKVYDELGKLVKTLINQFENKGSYNVNFNGSNLASGTYFYRLRAGNFVSTKKMLLLK